MTRANETDRFLLCSIGSRIGAVALRDVKETLRPLPTEPVLGAPPFVLGLTILRGAATPVIDAGRLLGPSASTSPPPLTRFVSLKLGERSVALAVDDVLDVRSLPTNVLASIPPLLQDASADWISAIGVIDSRLLIVLKAARLVPDSVWSAIKHPTASM